MFHYHRQRRSFHRYVREAIRAGDAHDYTVRIKGDARRLGKPNPPEGTEFLFTGPVQGVVMDYVPAFLQPKGQARWPALQGLSGTLTFEHAGMRVTNASAEVQEHKNWRFTDIQTDIADFSAPVVQVRASGSGALATALGIVRASPAAALTSHAMDGFKAEGNAALNLELDIPIKQPQKTLVRGSVDLKDNALRLADAAPPLAKAQGRVLFSERGFNLENVRAQALGGAAQASGGMDAGGVHVNVTGNASAEGIARMRDAWGPLAALAKNASGSLDYRLALGFPGGAVPSIHLESDTRGLTLNAPAPLTKTPMKSGRCALTGSRTAAAAARLRRSLAASLRCTSRNRPRARRTARWHWAVRCSARLPGTSKGCMWMLNFHSSTWPSGANCSRRWLKARRARTARTTPSCRTP
ncbi:MAG: hypothetical protein IKH84_04345 [Ottowia sp.]|nr:hypothetical protein [Ottowia sp.]